eukprot:754545-Amorphochlora_amoeboformis.AAC.1
MNSGQLLARSPNVNIAGMDIDISLLAAGKRRRELLADKLKSGRVWTFELPHEEAPESKKTKNAQAKDTMLDLDEMWNDLSEDEMAKENHNNPQQDFEAEFVSPELPRNRKPRSSLKGSRKREAEELGYHPSDQVLALNDSMSSDNVEFEDDLGGEEIGDLESPEPTPQDLEQAFPQELEPAEPQDLESQELGDSKYSKGDNLPEEKGTRRRRRRRQTLKIVDQARKGGFLDLTTPGGKGLRRSKRRRCKPLEWWNGERRPYERRTSGIGPFLPTLTTPTGKRADHFVDLEAIEAEKRAKRIAKRKARTGRKKKAGSVKGSESRKQKARKAKKKKNPQPKPEEEDIMVEVEDIKEDHQPQKGARGKKKRQRIHDDNAGEEEEDPHKFNSKAWVRDSAKNLEVQISVAKLSKQIKMVIDSLVQDDREDLPKTKLPQAGKSFEGDTYSTGKLVLPPEAVKIR